MAASTSRPSVPTGAPPSTEGEALALKGVTKRYGTQEALHEISLSVRYGEAVGYLGPNGAGKTTTLKVLAGLATPDQGEVLVAGDMRRGGHADPSSTLGVLIEMPGVLPYMLVRDLLLHVAEVRGLDAQRRGPEALKAAKKLGVDGVLDRPLGKLSTGQLRRVQLAATLVGDPKILLLDEPTLGLDPAARADLRALLRDLHREGRTLFLTTHLVEDVEQVCDRVLFLRDGRLAGDEPVHRVLQAGSRELRVRTLHPVAAEEIAPLLGAGVKAEFLTTRELLLTLPGGEEQQSHVLRNLAGSPYGLVEARTPDPDLAARYMAIVGREEGE